MQEDLQHQKIRDYFLSQLLTFPNVSSRVCIGKFCFPGDNENIKPLQNGAVLWRQWTAAHTLVADYKALRSAIQNDDLLQNGYHRDLKWLHPLQVHVISNMVVSSENTDLESLFLDIKNNALQAKERDHMAKLVVMVKPDSRIFEIDIALKILQYSDTFEIWKQNFLNWKQQGLVFVLFLMTKYYFSAIDKSIERFIPNNILSIIEILDFSGHNDLLNFCAIWNEECMLEPQKMNSLAIVIDKVAIAMRVNVNNCSDHDCDFNELLTQFPMFEGDVSEVAFRVWHSADYCIDKMLPTSYTIKATQVLQLQMSLTNDCVPRITFSLCENDNNSTLISFFLPCLNPFVQRVRTSVKDHYLCSLLLYTALSLRRIQREGAHLLFDCKTEKIKQHIADYKYTCELQQDVENIPPEQLPVCPLFSMYWSQITTHVTKVSTKTFASPLSFIAFRIDVPKKNIITEEFVPEVVPHQRAKRMTQTECIQPTIAGFFVAHTHVNLHDITQCLLDYIQLSSFENQNRLAQNVSQIEALYEFVVHGPTDEKLYKTPLGSKTIIPPSETRYCELQEQPQSNNFWYKDKIVLFETDEKKYFASLSSHHIQTDHLYYIYLPWISKNESKIIHVLSTKALFFQLLYGGDLKSVIQNHFLKNLLYNDVEIYHVNDSRSFVFYSQLGFDKETNELHMFGFEIVNA